MSKAKLLQLSVGMAVAAGASALAAASVDQASGARGGTIALQLAARNAESQAALLRGDVDEFLRKAGGLTHDFLLMSPFGGTPSTAADYTPDRLARMGQFFRDGSLRQEVVAHYESRDMVVLATIEHAVVAVAGLPAQPWKLRVTSVFVRRQGTWQLAHRHADPLVEDVSLDQSAALARGERADREKR